MLVLSASSANELFTAACHAVRATGRPAAPRQLATLEILGASLCLTDPRRRFVDLPPVRVLNPAFAAAEAVWILSGSDDPWIYQYNQRLPGYADDGRLNGRLRAAAAPLARHDRSARPGPRGADR